MDTVWSELDDLLQLCYSAADDVYLIHSQYTTSTSLWEIHVLDNSKGGSYHWARLTAGEDMKDQRSPPAESESGFVHWVVESLLAGQTTITARTEKLRIGTAQVYLDVHLNAAEDQDAYHRISWQLLIKLAQHIQKEGCSIGSDHSRLLKEENEYMNAQLNALMSQEAFVAGSPKESSPPKGSFLASHPSSSQRPLILPKRKGMSLINPRVKRHLHRTDSDP